MTGLWRRQSLPVRTAVVTTALVAGLTAAVTWVSIRREQQSFRSELEQQASVILETLAVSARGLLFRLDSDGLAGVARSLTSNGYLLEVRFYDERGRLVASSAGTTATSEVDPVGARLVGARLPLRAWRADHLTAGQVIEAAGKVFGAASIQLSTAPMLLKVRATRNQGVAVALVACVLGIAVAQLLSRTITRPLTELSRAARRIGAGDLDHEIPARSGGAEIAILSRSLEQMRVDLRMLYSVLAGEVADRARELEAANLALRNTNERLEAKAAELEQFAYTISHDLKSPLITINSFLGYIKESAETGNMPRLFEDLDRISVAASHMQRLLAALLELSRIGRIVNPPEPLSLDQLAREAIDHVAGGLGEGTIEVKLPPDLPQVQGDRVRLLEVFENLLENGIKYCGAAQPRIEISSRQRGEETCICVADNGIGIDPSHQGKVFDLFTKLDPRTEGSGVGLATVKRIVEVHGGRAWVESEGHGRGSRFWFSLPSPAGAAGTAPAPAQASG